MKQTLILLFVCLLSGCIPYPTIEREPEPHYLVLETRPYQRWQAFYNTPFYNPRLALDLWYEIAESGVDYGQLTKAPTPADELYSRERDLLRPLGGVSLHYFLARSRGLSPFDTCLWITRAGRISNPAEFDRWGQCRTLNAGGRQRVLDQGSAWREKWGSTSP